MKLSFVIYVLLIGITTSLFAQKKDKSKLSEEDQLKFNSAFLEAQKQKMLGKYDEAMIYYNVCLKIDPSSAACYYDMANIFLEENKIDEALLCANNAVTRNDENFWYKILLAKTYEKKGDSEHASVILKKIIKEYPDKPDLYIDLAQMYYLMNKPKESIAVLDQLENQIGLTEEISLEKERIYVQLGKSNDAINELNKLIKAFPGESRYYGLLAELYITMKEYDKAEEMFLYITKTDPGNGLGHLSLADFYRMKGEFEKSFEELKIAFGSQDVNIDLKVQMMVSFYAFSSQTEKLNEQAYTLLDILLKTHPNDSKVLTIYADYLTRDNRYTEAREKYRIVLQTEKDKYLIWEQLFMIELQLIDYESLLKESTEALEYFPNQPMLYVYNGISCFELKKYADAINILKEGLDYSLGNTKAEIQIYSYLGEAYHKIKNNFESDNAFDELLKRDPNNKIVLNNYSYYLSLRNDSLVKAEKMAKRCIGLDPENHTYLDTYAWVLYKAGKYNEARTIIEKAIFNGGKSSAAILEHYGDILYKDGLTDEAQKQWKAAQNAGKGSEFLDKKVETGKLIE